MQDPPGGNASMQETVDLHENVIERIRIDRADRGLERGEGGNEKRQRKKHRRCDSKAPPQQKTPAPILPWRKKRNTRQQSVPPLVGQVGDQEDKDRATDPHEIVDAQREACLVKEAHDEGQRDVDRREEQKHRIDFERAQSQQTQLLQTIIASDRFHAHLRSPQTRKADATDRSHRLISLQPVTSTTVPIFPDQVLQPPSTIWTAPVVKAASSLAR